MERECCLSVMSILFGGILIEICGWWSSVHESAVSGRDLERLRWKELWLPIIPALIVVAWLCGWAAVEPDPVPEQVPIWLVLASVPFGLVVARAVIRAAWSLFREDGDPGTATVGLLKPWIVFSPRLARTLDERALEAALDHERAHARHRDPLRIWLAQLATDLCWPWPQAQLRLRRWIVALELARDEEARASGAEGSDLAAAILASVRLREQTLSPVGVQLTGDAGALQERIGCLLNPLADPALARNGGARLMPALLAIGLMSSAVLGSAFGERVIGTLLRIAA